MRVETVCTGDELLTGLTADTNSRFFQERLLHEVGLTVRRGLVVGDVRSDIIEALKEAAARSDAVLVSGGLGPTADDITAECAAEAANVPLVHDAAVWAHIEARLSGRGVKITPNARRQAQLPRGAEIVLNAEGSAPLFIMKLGKATCFFVPGVPVEYRHLVERHVVPRLKTMHEQSTQKTVRLLRSLRTIGLPESHLDAKVQPLFAEHPKVTFGFRTHPPENHLKLLAEGSTQAEAQAALEAAERASRETLQPFVFGIDGETLPHAVGEVLQTRHQTLAVAESCTGGLLAELITQTPGASRWFRGGAVTYQGEVKWLLAQVPLPLIEEHGEVSEPVARAMAEGIRNRLDASWALSVTGLAGPTGGTELKPVGTVFIGLAGPHRTQVARFHFHGDRERVRLFAAMNALDLLRRTLTEPT